MKMKSLFLAAFLFIFCLFLLTCKEDKSIEFNKSNDFALQATPTINKLNANENKPDSNENLENGNVSKETGQNFDLPKIQVADSEYEKYRQKIFFALLKQKIISSERTLINLNHVCSLKAGKNTFLVVNIFELIKNVSSDRGYNRIVLLDNSLKVVNTLTIFADSSLFCDENKLYLHSSKIGFDADILSDNAAPITNSDNTILFDDVGRVKGSQTTDFHDLPALKEKLKKGLTPQ